MVPFTKKFEFCIENGSLDTQNVLETICSKYRKAGFNIENKKDKVRIGIPIRMYVQTWQLFGMTDSIELGFTGEKDSVKFTYTFNATSWWIFSIGISVFIAIYADNIIIGIGALIVLGGGNYGIMTLHHSTHYIELKEKIKKRATTTKVSFGLKGLE